MKESSFSTTEIEHSPLDREQDATRHHLGSRATHELAPSPSNTPEINQNYSDSEFPMLSHVTIDGQDYMITGTWFSVDDNYNYTTDMLAVQRMTADGETLELTPSDLRERIDVSEDVKQPSAHFEITQGANGSTTIDMLHDDKKFLSLEIDGGYAQEELAQFVASVESALSAIDTFVDGKSYILFDGLKIKIGENVSAGGGQAISAENLVLMNGRKTLISLADMRTITGSYENNELKGGSIDEHNPTGALQYNLVHEIGHILDERTESGDRMHRVSATESPTKYGREPDQYNSEKDHEAFAEGFAHMVYDMPVSDKLAEAIHQTINAKLAE